MSPAPRPRLLVVAETGGHGPDRDELRRRIAADELPDSVIAEDRLDGVSLDERGLRAVGGPRGRLLHRLPVPLALTAEVWARRGDVDVVLSWSESVTFPLAALLAISGHPFRLIAVFRWPFDATGASRARTRVKLAVSGTLARRGIDRFIVHGPVQRRLVAERWRIPPERFIAARRMVDRRFWRPLPEVAEQPMICAVGREMRDYDTLLAALDGLGIPCHIAVGTGALNPAYGTDDTRAANVAGAVLPEGVTAGPKTARELRELYATSRIVIVPSLPTTTDNGVTSLTEAMAMGRPVIATATEGRAEVLKDGINCLLVAPRDAEALRAAIRRLYDDPELRARLGATARHHVIAAHGIETWLERVRAAVAELTAPAPAASPAQPAPADAEAAPDAPLTVAQPRDPA